jgi:protein-tyrosine kinase
MGKLFDALERKKEEKNLKTQSLPMAGPDEPLKREPGITPSKEIFITDALNPKLVAATAPHSLEAENFKVLRAQILFPKNGTRRRIIMVTSVFPGEGKTFVASNLAVSIAMGINEHVLLVDCDFRRPSLHAILGYSKAEGLHEFLTEKRQLPDLLIKTGIDKLSLLPSGTPSKRPSELLASRKMKEFLTEVRDRYDDRFIILDTTPIQVTSEAGILSNYVDGVLFVVMAGKTPREAIQRSIEKVGKEKVLGIVFNAYEQGIKRYGYYYKNYYK